jgi:TrmH family RNA methyltransferase
MSAINARNPAVQHLRRLARRRSARSEAGAFVIDGPVLVAEALDAGVELEAVYLDSRAADAAASPSAAASTLAVLVDRLRGSGVRLLEVAPDVLAGAVDTVTPQSIAAIARLQPRPLRFATSSATGLLVVLAGVSDPGNAGTLLRSAEAAGARALIATDGSVDLFAPKTVRASAGSLFRVPVIVGGALEEVVADLQQAGVRCLGTTAQGGVPYDEADLASGVAIVLGNEARGLDRATLAGLDGVTTIPMAGSGESLNVAMAGTLLCFESARQRRAAAR